MASQKREDDVRLQQDGGQTRREEKQAAEVDLTKDSPALQKGHYYERDPHYGPPPDYQDRGYQDRGYQDRGYQDRGYQDRGYQDRGYDNPDVEGGYPGQTDQFAFSEKSIRMAFIRKVYTIVSLQLLVNVSIVALMYRYDQVVRFTPENLLILVGMCVMMLVLSCVFYCCPFVTRSFPLNYILLFAFTGVFSYVLGWICYYSDFEVVLLALAITVVICVALTIFAFQTSIDFTGIGPYLYLLFILSVCAGLFFAIYRPSQPVRIAYAGAGALLFCVYLVYDTQLMIGGNHKFAFSPEDYVYAAMCIYSDVITIFLKILEILNELNSRSRRD